MNDINDINEQLKQLGYSKSQINKIKSRANTLGDKHSILLRKDYIKIFNSLLNVLGRVGINKDDLIKITSFFPALLLLHEEIFNKEKLNNIIDYFLQRNISINNLKKMILKNPRFLISNIEKIKDKISFLNEFFYDKEIDKIIVSDSFVLSLKRDVLKEKRDYLVSLFGEETIKQLILKNTDFLSLKTENIQEKYEFFLNFGYSKELLIKMFVTYPNLISLTSDNIKGKFNVFLENGFSKDDFIELSSTSSNVLSISKENLEKKFFIFKELGYSLEEIRKLVIGYPSILAMSIENSFVPKLSFISKYDGIKREILNNPRKLMQSLSVTYARFNYLNSISFDFNTSGYSVLFTSHSRFEKSFNINKENLLEMYPLSIEFSPFNK